MKLGSRSVIELAAVSPRTVRVRILGSALAGALALSGAMPAHADPPGTKFGAGAAPAIVQPSAGLASHPAPGLGGWHSSLLKCARRMGYGFRRRTVLTDSEVPTGDGQAPLLFGEEHPIRPSTCPMCGEAHSFPTPATVTGARYGILTPSGEARRAAGVIRSCSQREFPT